MAGVHLKSLSKVFTDPQTKKEVKAVNNLDLDIRDGDEGVDVDSSVQLDDVRRQLNCNAIVTEPTKPETPKTPPVEVVVPGGSSGSGNGGDVSQLPIGGVETGTQ